jgi:hypothetical protein
VNDSGANPDSATAARAARTASGPACSAYTRIRSPVVGPTPSFAGVGRNGEPDTVVPSKMSRTTCPPITWCRRAIPEFA